MLRLISRCLALVILTLVASESRAALVIAGSHQGWTPPTGNVMSDLGGAIYEANLTGLSADTNFLFKILDDQGSAADGDPEWTQDNNWFRSDGSGNATIRLNTNIGTTGQNNMNVGISSDSWTPQLVGDFMNEAGGLGDWNPSDATFNMTSMGRSQWQHVMTISSPGTYLIKITDGTGWDRQFGSDGFWANPGSFSFTTINPNETVIVNFNSLNPSFSVVPEPSSMVMLTSLFGLVSFARSRKARR